MFNTDSSRVTLRCLRGMTSDCCETLMRADKGLCGTAGALLHKARWRGVISHPTDESKPMDFEARAVVSDLGDWGFELSGVEGYDAAGAFALRRGASSSSWCDTRRGCLKETAPRAPLTDGQLNVPPGGYAIHGGQTRSYWVSASSRVRAVLAGRIAAVDTARLTAGPDSAIVHVSVRVYHGSELYVVYGPLRPAPGVNAGALVKAGSYLGDARPHSSALGGGRYALTVDLRRAGQPLDAEDFWQSRFVGTAPLLSLHSVAPSMTGVP